MDIKGQINHRATARTMPERLSHVSQNGVESGENMISWNTYNQSYSRKSDKQRVGQTSDKTGFYEDEYQKMVSRMDKKVVPARNIKTADPFGELVHLSLLVDEKHRGAHLGYVDSPPPTIPPPSKGNLKVSIQQLLNWKRYQDEKHELFMSMMRKLEVKDIERFEHLERVRKRCKLNSAYGGCENHLRDISTPEQHEGRMSNTSEGDSSMSSMPNGDFMRSSAPEEDLRMGGMQDAYSRKHGAQCGDFITGTTLEDDFMVDKTVPLRPLEAKPMNVNKSTTKTKKVSVCRHFTKGWCRQGEACSFQHREESSHPDTQKVFLGGLPHSITPAKLLWELRQQGYVVINQPNIFRGFSPQVCLSSTVEAMKLLQKGKIMICGCTVDVRPYKASTKKERDRQHGMNKRSVFLGGLPSTVTLKILKSEIKKLGMKVTNRPRIKAGFIPKVTLASVQEAEQLVAKGTIDIIGAVISVRAYVSET